MLARVIALVLAVVMMTGAVAQVWASPDDAGAVAGAAPGSPPGSPPGSIDDDGLALDPAVLPEIVAVPLPERREPVSTCAPDRDVPGRLHAVFVFRPPRPIASR